MGKQYFELILGVAALLCGVTRCLFFLLAATQILWLVLCS